MIFLILTRIKGKEETEESSILPINALILPILNQTFDHNIPSLKAKTLTGKLLYYSLFSLGQLPLRILYFCFRWIGFIAFRLLNYRKKTIDTNLGIVFPDQSDHARTKIARQFHRHFSDLLAETIKLPYFSNEELSSRFDIRISAELQNYIDQNKDVFIAGAHINQWEWAVAAAGQQLPCRAVGIYKPIHQSGTEAYFKAIRQKWNTEMVAMAQVVRDLYRKDRPPSAYLFLSDQSTPHTSQAHYHPFFNIETPFVPGMAQLAHKFNIPIFYFYIEKISRGHYFAHFVPLIDQPKKLNPNEITALYVKRLTEHILNEPTNWLWTHKRWKRVLKY